MPRINHSYSLISGIVYSGLNDFQVYKELKSDWENSRLKLAFSVTLIKAEHLISTLKSAKIISRTSNARSSAPAARTTGNNATKSSSSGSSDPDPEPRRQTPLQYTRLTLARALNATARLIGGAR